MTHPIQEAETRTAQDLLAERRYSVQELRQETCEVARAMLKHHIMGLDRQIAALPKRTCWAW